MKSTDVSSLTSAKLLRLYYAGTLIFIILDYFFGINVRLAFLEAWPGIRALYYFLCVFCLGLMFWRPDWSLWIGTIESALALSLLIVTMGVRVMTVSEQLLVTGTGLVTMSEIMNFMIVGMAAWVAWMRGIAALGKQSGVKI
jgi:hypothetical protein